jgi:pentose-5-phosphate-3-epimerase
MMEKVETRVENKNRRQTRHQSMAHNRQRLSIQNGANALVAGTSIFHSKDYAEAIRELRGIK